MEGIIPPLYLALARPHLDTAYGLRTPTARETSTNRNKPREVLVMVGGRRVYGGRGYMWPGCRSRACSAAGKEAPGSRGHLLWPKGVLEILWPDPAPTGTVRALEAPAQVVAPDTAPRRQPFPCKQGVSVLGDNPDALGHSPKELWCWPCFGKGFGQEISTGLYQTKIFL